MTRTPGDAVITTDGEGHVTSLNPVASELTGWSAEAASGRPLHEVCDLVAPGGQERLRTGAGDLVAALARHPMLVARDGDERRLAATPTPIRGRCGTVNGFVLVFPSAPERGGEVLEPPDPEDEVLHPRPSPPVEARALLAAVVRSSSDAIVTKTLDGIITSWNAGAERLFGYTRDEAVGRHIDLIIPADRLDEERQLLARLRRGEWIDPFETVRVTKSGALLDVSLTLSPIRDRRGRIVGASKVGRNLTEARRAERALRESEGRFAQLANNAPAAIFIKDLHGRYVLANPLAQQALGRHDSVLGLTDHDLLPKEIADALRRRDREVVRTGRAIENEELVGQAGHPNRYLSVKFPLRDDTGAAVGVCGVAIDVTDRHRAAEALRESEERFRTLADHIAQFAWMADGDGSIFWYNRRWFEYTGTTLEQVRGWGWRAMHHPDHVDRVVEKISHCFRTGEVWEDTFPLRGADGRYRWFLSRAIPIRNEEGRVTRWLGTNTDVTDQQEAEAALKEANRAKDAFLATLAHELRNPLAAVRNSLEILKLADDEPELLSQGRTVIDRQVAHLERLVEDLLDVARIRRDRLTLRPTRVELHALLEQAVETCRHLVDAAGVTLRMQPPEERIELDADAVRLVQVVSNLLANACKYTPRGGRVDLVARPDGDTVVVSVRDTGRGIPPDRLDRVFDLFVQVEPSGDSARSGLGIGLNLVRRLVEMHGGSVQAASRGVGHGSEFSVRLPIADRAVTTAPAAPTAGPSGDGLRVLVVDDNVDAATSLSLLLERAGHRTFLAHDGEDAIRQAEAQRPDVVLLDIGLPGVDGHVAARRIRAQWGRDLTLVAITGWGQDADRRRSREAGFDHHLVKPVKVDALRSLLEGIPRRA